MFEDDDGLVDPNDGGVALAEPEDTVGPSDLFIKLTKDLRESAKLLTHAQLRWLVDTYYSMQAARIRAENQVRAEDQKLPGQPPEPNLLIQTIADVNWKLERTIMSALNVRTDQTKLSRWAKSVHGIGPVIAAGLLAHIDIPRCRTVGQIWRFAGLDPSVVWEGTEHWEGVIKSVLGGHPKRALTDEEFAQVAIAAKTTSDKLRHRLYDFRSEGQRPATVSNIAKALARRPWNARLKVLAWKIGVSFMKQSGSPKCFYGDIWKRRKELETTRNEAGAYKEQAEAALREKNYGKDTDAYAAYITGKLPKARIELRAERYATKLFLSHYHHVGRLIETGEPPVKPYVLDKLHGHEVYIPPPGLEVLDKI